MTKTDAERQRFVRAYMETPKIAEIKSQFPNLSIRSMQYWVKQMKEKGHLNAGKSSGRKPKHTIGELEKLDLKMKEKGHLNATNRLPFKQLEGN